MSSKVLIIGAGGRIGRHMLPHLSSRCEWVLADRTEGEIDGRPVQALDITDYQATLAAMEGMDVVVHLAIASPREFVTDRARFDAHEGEEYRRFNEASIEVNLRGTYHVFEAARAAGVKRVVYGSSLIIFLGEPCRETIHDDLPFQPVNFYGVTKLWGEQLGEFFSRRYGLTVYCLRFGTPYPVADRLRSLKWKDLPPGQRSGVTLLDLAAAIEAAVLVQDGPAFGAYSIVSAAENSIYDCSKAAEIGWQPLTRLEADGSITRLHPPGEIPERRARVESAVALLSP